MKLFVVQFADDLCATKLNIRRRGGRLGQLDDDGGNIGDVDEEFWAQAAASRDAGPTMDVDFDDGGSYSLMLAEREKKGKS